MHDPIANMISNLDAAIEDVKDMADITKTVCIDEAEKLRRENAALRQTVARLRHTYEAPRAAAKVHITLDVSEGLSPACLTLLQESLTGIARSALLLHEGHDRAPTVTCKINVPAPSSSISFT